jgi:ATP-dependent RNA helicase DDX46/PRP5
MAGGATWQPPRQPPPPPGSPPPPENPILAAAQAVARRLAKEAGIPFSAYTPQQPGGVQMPTAAQQQQMQQQMQQQQQTQQQAQQPQYVPGMPGILMPGAMPALPASLAAQMLPPGGMPMQLPGAPAMPPGGLPGGLGASVGLGQAAAAPAAPLKHFETELEINDFPQHARWKVRVCVYVWMQMCVYASMCVLVGGCPCWCWVLAWQGCRFRQCPSAQ